jgi:hypothetical protein
MAEPTAQESIRDSDDDDEDEPDFIVNPCTASSQEWSLLESSSRWSQPLLADHAGLVSGSSEQTQPGTAPRDAARPRHNRECVGRTLSSRCD